MTVEAKICGLSTPDSVDVAIAYGARWLGFVTYPRSPRHIATEALRALAARVPRAVGKVGLFVDPDDRLLDERLAAGGFDLLQLHGEESPERLVDIKARTGTPVMKVIKVARREDVERGIAAYAAAADRLMFDAAEGTLPGGNAQAFDWTFLSSRDVPMPWLLAGGLTPENVVEAVRVTGARAVDVSSGVEATRGVKSIERIKAFLERVRGIA